MSVSAMVLKVKEPWVEGGTKVAFCNVPTTPCCVSVWSADTKATWSPWYWTVIMNHHANVVGSQVLVQLGQHALYGISARPQFIPLLQKFTLCCRLALRDKAGFKSSVASVSLILALCFLPRTTRTRHVQLAKWCGLYVLSRLRSCWAKNVWRRLLVCYRTYFGV